MKAISIVFFASFLFTLNANATNYITAITGMDFYSNRSNNKFTNYLANEYKSLSLYKAEFTNDINDANYFAQKALSAYHGEKVNPDNVRMRSVPLSSIVEISSNYDDLLSILGTDIKDEYPLLTASAQAKFDCWIESEEEGNIKQIQTCKTRFLKAKNAILKKLDVNCGECEDISLKKAIVKRPKEFDGKLLNIPQWPRVSIIENNPPKPVKLSKQVIITPTINTNDIDCTNISIKNLEDKISTLQNTATVRIQIPTVQTQASTARTQTITVQPQTVYNDNSELIIQNIKNLEDDIYSISKQIEEIQLSNNEAYYPEDNYPDDNYFPQEKNKYEVIEQTDYIEDEIFDEPYEFFPYEVFFDWNKSNVDYKFLPQLKDISEQALTSKERIIIQGHTDTSGTPKYNEKLSDERAISVAKIIESYGISPDKITIQAMGSKDLKVPTKQGVRQPENRRVVIK